MPLVRWARQPGRNRISMTVCNTLCPPLTGVYKGPWYNYGANNSAEPNNAMNPPEECVVADYLSRFNNPNDTGVTGEGWGWADENCGDMHASICRYKPGELLR